MDACAATVREREAAHTAREVMEAKEVRDLQKITAFPGDAALAWTMQHGGIINNTSTSQHLRTARDIYGPLAEPSLAGKSKDLGPLKAESVPVVVEMRREQKAYADVFYWHEIPFVLCIVKPLNLVLVHKVTKGLDNSSGMLNILETFRNRVENRGYHVEKFYTDADKKLAALVGRVDGLAVAGAGTHVGEVEVEIKVMEERCRAVEASLPVPVLVRHVEHLVYHCAAMRNIVIRKGRSISPREAFTGQKTDRKKDLRAPFYEYCYAYRTPRKKNGPEVRAVPCLFLGHLHNDRGSVLMYDLLQHSIFSCDRFTRLPMPELVISMMIKLWDTEKKPGARKLRAAWQLGRNPRNPEEPMVPHDAALEQAEFDELVPPIAERDEAL